MEHTNTLRQFKQRAEESNKQKIKKQKRQDKINKLSSLDKHWKGLEQIDHIQITDPHDNLNKTCTELRRLYETGAEMRLEEWVNILLSVLKDTGYK